MRKMKYVAFWLLVALPVLAQDIPLFDDELPNLGRQAQPLSELRVTPSELPDVSVSLKEDPNKKVTKVTPSSKRPVAPVARKIQLRDEQVKLSSEQSQALNKQLQAEMQQFQDQKAKEEQEKKLKVQQAALAAAQKKTQVEVTQTAVANPLTDLFGKLHDVRTFDISGIFLGMTPDEVIDELSDVGYAVTKEEYGIPLHRTSFYDQACRKMGGKRIEDIHNCIIEMAQDDDVYYVSSLTFAKPSTAEYIQVLFSSLETDNAAFKIYYENEGDNSLGFTRKNLAQKISRRDAFWKKIYDTYGYPDDADLLIWGDPQKAYMKVQMQGSNYNAYIILEDREVSDTDLIDMDEKGKELPHFHKFTFAEDD